MHWKQQHLWAGYDMEPPLKSAVAVYPDNSINRPEITNTHWTTEIAMPISKLMERNPHSKKPADGVFWRINFSRVQWGVNVNESGDYEKSPCCQSCASPGSSVEDNWVWSKQGEVAMHLPERWGIVQFSSKPPQQEDLKYYEEWPSRCAAMALWVLNVCVILLRVILTTSIEWWQTLRKVLCIKRIL